MGYLAKFQSFTDDKCSENGLEAEIEVGKCNVGSQYDMLSYFNANKLNWKTIEEDCCSFAIFGFCLSGTSLIIFIVILVVVFLVMMAVGRSSSSYSSKGEKDTKKGQDPEEEAEAEADADDVEAEPAKKPPVKKPSAHKKK